MLFARKMSNEILKKIVSCSMSQQNYGTTMSDDQETLKMVHFKQAMQRYENNVLYTVIERSNSVIVIVLQVITFLHLLVTYDQSRFWLLLFSFLLAYMLTDFINGLVHMYMDNNTCYTSWMGPLVAVFHLHHSKLLYKNRHPLQIWFYESGNKYWLTGYLLLLVFFQQEFNLYYVVNFTLVSIGILSSLAELSHYWCHNSTVKNTVITRLQKCHILLPKKHHFIHHRHDNIHYAFLNGMTDPVLNKIAKYYYPGYKNHADKHAHAFMKDALI